MGSKGSKKNDSHEKPDFTSATVVTSNQSINSIPNSIPTKSTQADIISNSKSVQGIASDKLENIYVPPKINENSPIPDNSDQLNTFPYTLSGENNIPE